LVLQYKYTTVNGDGSDMFREEALDLEPS